MRGTGYWEVRKMGRVEGKSSETGFMGFVGLGNCQNRGLARITRMTRIMGLGDGGQESGIGVPSYQVRKRRAYKALPQESSLLPSQKESGLQSPPTREFPPTKSESVGLTKPSHKRVPSYQVRKRRAYKALPQESSLLQRKRRAYKALPQESSLLQKRV